MVPHLGVCTGGQPRMYDKKQTHVSFRQPQQRDKCASPALNTEAVTLSPGDQLHGASKRDPGG
jgi:hypothetical protein